MESPPLGPSGEDITWPDQVAPRGRKASSTRKIKPQTSNLSGSRGLHPRQAKGQEIHSVLSNVTSISYTERQDPANQVSANGGACSRTFQGYVPERKR